MAYFNLTPPAVRLLEQHEMIADASKYPDTRGNYLVWVDEPYAARIAATAANPNDAIRELFGARYA